MKIFNKSRIAWTISALFMVAVTSCSKDEPAEQSPLTSPSAGQILFTSEQAGLTVKSALIGNSDFVTDAGSTLKTTLHDNVTWWTATTDRTGIYSTEARTATSAGGTLGIVNNEYIADNTAASTPFTATIPMFWGVANTTHNFYAYYPYLGGSSAAAAVPVGLLSTQSQVVKNNFDHIGALDFLVATPISVTSPANTDQTSHTYVHLVYNHLFSIVEFNIAGSGTIGGVRLTGTDLGLAGALIDIKQSTPAPGVAYTLANQGSKAGAVIVNLATAATLTATATDTKVYMVIYPGYAGTCSIEFLNGGVWKNLVTKQAPAGGFLRGQKYVVTVNAATTPVPAPTSWSATVEPIIQSKCATCHGTTGGTAGINMGTYAQVAALSNTQIDNAGMYTMGSVTAAEQASIKAWVAEGKINN